LLATLHSDVVEAVRQLDLDQRRVRRTGLALLGEVSRTPGSYPCSSRSGRTRSGTRSFRRHPERWRWRRESGAGATRRPGDPLHWAGIGCPGGWCRAAVAGAGQLPIQRCSRHFGSWADKNRPKIAAKRTASCKLPLRLGSLAAGRRVRRRRRYSASTAGGSGAGAGQPGRRARRASAREQRTVAGVGAWVLAVRKAYELRYGVTARSVREEAVPARSLLELPVGTPREVRRKSVAREDEVLP
jgi:hypothetical protein